MEADLERYHRVATLVRETYGMLVNQRKAFCQLEAKLFDSNSGSHHSYDSDMASTASAMQSLQMGRSVKSSDIYVCVQHTVTLL